MPDCQADSHHGGGGGIFSSHSYSHSYSYSYSSLRRLVVEGDHYREVVGQAVVAGLVAEVAGGADLDRGVGVVDVEHLIDNLAVVVAVALAVRAAVIVAVGGRIGHYRLARIGRIDTRPWIFNPRIGDGQAIDGVDGVDEQLLDLVAGVAEVRVTHQYRRAAVAVRDDVARELAELGVLRVDVAAAGRAVGVHVGDVNINLRTVLEGDEVVAEALGDARVGSCRQSAVGLVELDAGLVLRLHALGASPGEVDAVRAALRVVAAVGSEGELRQAAHQRGVVGEVL